MRTDASTRARRRRLATVGATLAPLVLVVACAGGPASATLELGWSLVDGRRCEDAGATRVTVTIADGDATLAGASDMAFPDAGTPARLVFECSAGEGASAVAVTVAHPSGATLRLEATSPAGSALYRGQLTVGDPPPASVRVPLYFLGGG